MEKENELSGLIRVLQQTSRMAFQSEWTGSVPGDAADICLDRHNRILSRLKEIDPGLSTIFEPLPPNSSLTAIAIACRQLAAYYEDQIHWSSRWKHVYDAACDPKAVKDFWRKSKRDIQDLGEYMRECADEWARRRKEKSEREPDNK
jgi:hypothetical protein